MSAENNDINESTSETQYAVEFRIFLAANANIIVKLMKERRRQIIARNMVKTENAERTAIR